jgi:multisubunit Na+/H+ antiporter MnhE subunit
VGRTAGRWAVPSIAFVLLFLTWIAIVASLDPPELAAGAAAAALATAGVEVVRRSSSNRGHVRLRWLGVALRAALRIPAGFARVASTLLPSNGREGTFQELPFPVAGHDRWSVGRRVATLIETSLPPESYVVDFDPERSTILVHTLGGRRLSEDDLRVAP